MIYAGDCVEIAYECVYSPRDDWLVVTSKKLAPDEKDVKQGKAKQAMEETVMTRHVTSNDYTQASHLFLYCPLFSMFHQTSFSFLSSQLPNASEPQRPRSLLGDSHLCYIGVTTPMHKNVKPLPYSLSYVSLFVWVHPEGDERKKELLRAITAGGSNPLLPLYLIPGNGNTYYPCMRQD